LTDRRARRFAQFAKCHVNLRPAGLAERQFQFARYAAHAIAKDSLAAMGLQSSLDLGRPKAAPYRSADFRAAILFPFEKQMPTCAALNFPFDRETTASQRQGAVLARIGGELVQHQSQVDGRL